MGDQVKNEKNGSSFVVYITENLKILTNKH